jgi:glycosyltransferase involved in cell wall biosynthesis
VKAIFCVPTTGAKPYPQFVAALEASLPHFEAAGIETGVAQEAGSPYISHARSKMLRRALDNGADVVAFLDHDLSWQPDALLRLVTAKANVVGGTYRFKRADERYMGALTPNAAGLPMVRADGLLRCDLLPAGFLMVTSWAVDKFMRAYPELTYGTAYAPSVDLFNHGAYRGQWWGEDYAFCRRWTGMGEPLYLMPDLAISHWGADGTEYPGNFHDYLRRQPGGDLHREADE